MFGAIKPVTYIEAKNFCLIYHYTKRFPQVVLYKWGLFKNGDLKGISTFGLPASPWVSISATGSKNNVIELSRLALADNLPNEASWFVSRCLKLLEQEWEGVLVSYADVAQHHHGGIYQALGFHYGGCSRPRTDIYTDGHPRHHNGDPSKRKYRSPKHRYWLSIPRRKYNCEWGKLPYPKPDLANV